MAEDWRRALEADAPGVEDSDAPDGPEGEDWRVEAFRHIDAARAAQATEWWGKGAFSLGHPINRLPPYAPGFAGRGHPLPERIPAQTGADGEALREDWRVEAFRHIDAARAAQAREWWGKGAFSLGHPINRLPPNAPGIGGRGHPLPERAPAKAAEGNPEAVDWRVDAFRHIDAARAAKDKEWWGHGAFNREESLNRSLLTEGSPAAVQAPVPIGAPQVKIEPGHQIYPIPLPRSGDGYSGPLLVLQQTSRVVYPPEPANGQEPLLGGQLIGNVDVTQPVAEAGWQPDANWWGARGGYYDGDPGGPRLGFQLLGHPWPGFGGAEPLVAPNAGRGGQTASLSAFNHNVWGTDGGVSFDYIDSANNEFIVFLFGDTMPYWGNLVGHPMGKIALGTNAPATIDPESESQPLFLDFFQVPDDLPPGSRELWLEQLAGHIQSHPTSQWPNWNGQYGKNSNWPLTVAVVPTAPEGAPDIQKSVFDNPPLGGINLYGGTPQSTMYLSIRQGFDPSDQSKAYSILARMQGPSLGPHTPFATSVDPEVLGNPFDPFIGHAAQFVRVLSPVGGKFVHAIFHPYPSGPLPGVDPPPSGDWVLMYGSGIDDMPLTGRDPRANVYLAAVAQSDFASSDAPTYYWKESSKSFLLASHSGDDRLATPLTNDGSINMFSVAYVDALRMWIMLYDFGFPRDNAVGRRVAMKVAENPWGPWSDPGVIFTAGLGEQEWLLAAGATGPAGPALPGPTPPHGNIYGPHIVERFTQVSETSPQVLTLYFTLCSNAPYYVVLMKAMFEVAPPLLQVGGPAPPSGWGQGWGPGGPVGPPEPGTLGQGWGPNPTRNPRQA